MKLEPFRVTWEQVRPVVWWGALAHLQVVALIPIWGIFALDGELEEWITMGVPFFLAIVVQPFLGSMAGARLFGSKVDATSSWIDRVVVGFLALLLAPLPAEAVRLGLLFWHIESPTRAQLESWMFLLIAIPVTAICFASGTMFAHVFRRTSLAALTAFLASLVFMTGVIAALPDDDAETVVVAVAMTIATLFVASAIVSFAKRIPLARGFPLPAAAVAVFAVCVVGVSQYAAFSRERSELYSMSRELEADLENAKTTGARLQDFRREYERKEAVLEALRRMLPASLDAKRFVEELSEVAAEHGVEVVVHELEMHRYDFYEEAVVTVGLAGDDSAILALEETVMSASLIVHWVYLDEGSYRAVELSLFAAPPPPARATRATCPAPDGAASRVWFGPFANEISEERERMDVLCSELARLAPIVETVHDYQLLLTELEEVSRLVEWLDER